MRIGRLCWRRPKTKTKVKTKNILRYTALRSVPFWSHTASMLPATVLARLVYLVSCFVLRDSKGERNILRYFVRLAFFLGHLRPVNSLRKIRAFLVYLVSCFVLLTSRKARNKLQQYKIKTAFQTRNAVFLLVEVIFRELEIVIPSTSVLSAGFHFYAVGRGSRA